MSLGDQPAFPCARSEWVRYGTGERNGRWCDVTYPGMTKREVFTALALMGMANADISYEVAAMQAVQHADAALAELEKPQDDSTSEPS